MKIELQGRKALVTGSTAGIGFAIARGLAAAGASVVVNGRTQQRVDAALQSLRELEPAGDFSGIAADVATAEGSETLLAQLSDVDILVNNAGTAHPKGFFEQTDEEWIDLYQLNVLSGVRASRHYMPGMLERGWGRIVFISSEAAIVTPKEMIDYGVTKTAQLAVSRGLAELAKGSGVTVNAVLPGPTDSEIVGNWMKATAEAEGITVEQAQQNFLRDTARPMLIDRFATTTEVANLVVYVCSDLSSATTGASLRVDGGVVRSII